MAKKTTTESPMMKQYNDLKAKHPDAFILFRCGDFYETYAQDAEDASKILGITLTKRANDNVAMAGFPYHALDTYLPKLIRAGKRVAICDQLEDTCKVVDVIKPANEQPIEKQPEDMTIAELMTAYKQLKEENEALKEKQGCSAIELKEVEERVTKESEKAEYWMKRAEVAETKLEAIKNALNG